MAGIDTKVKQTKQHKMLGFSQLNIFCEQIAMVLTAGISVYEGICILHEEATSPAEQELLQCLIDTLDEGESFPKALERSGAFPKYMLDMLEIGELSGRLDTVLEQLARYYKREEAVSQAVRHAISYPIAMLVMIGIVISVLIAKVLPIFNSVFADLGSELTGFSKNVMDLGLAFSGSLWVLFGLIVVLLILLVLATKTKKGKQLFKKFKEHCFGIRNFTYKIAVSRFASGMSLMLASGLDLDQSLEMVLPLVDHDAVHQKVELIRQSVSMGENFAKAVDDHHLFSGTYNRMLGIGYKTGTTDEIIENIANRYEEEIETNLSGMIAIIEPSLVAVLSIVVGVILLAVMLPLMSIMSAI